MFLLDAQKVGKPFIVSDIARPDICPGEAGPTRPELPTRCLIGGRGGVRYRRGGPWAVGDFRCCYALAVRARTEGRTWFPWRHHDAHKERLRVRMRVQTARGHPAAVADDAILANGVPAALAEFCAATGVWNGPWDRGARPASACRARPPGSTWTRALLPGLPARRQGQVAPSAQGTRATRAGRGGPRLPARAASGPPRRARRR